MTLVRAGFFLLDVDNERLRAFTIARILPDITQVGGWILALYATVAPPASATTSARPHAYQLQSRYVLWREFRSSQPNNFVLRIFWLLEFVILVIRFVTNWDSVKVGSHLVELQHVTSLMLALLCRRAPRAPCSSSGPPW